MSASALPWYYDLISPYAYLQLLWLRRDHPTLALEPRPVLLGAVLQHHGQLGPAEIPGKREFTYRYVLWRAQELGFPLRFPPRHPFNPVAALRLVLAAGGGIAAVETAFRHIWQHGEAVDTPEGLARLATALGIDDAEAAAADPAVKAQLKQSTEAAIAAGVYGVPTLVVHEALYFGQDATPMALAALADPHMLERDEYARVAQLPVGASRR